MASQPLPGFEQLCTICQKPILIPHHWPEKAEMCIYCCIDERDALLQHHLETLRTCSPQHPRYETVQSNIMHQLDVVSLVLNSGYMVTGEIRFLNRTIEIRRMLLQNLPAKQVFRLKNSLASNLEMRFQQTNVQADLDEAVEIFSELESWPEPHPGRPSMLANFGNVLSSRYDTTGSIEDLTCAIGYLEIAVASSHDTHLELLPDGVSPDEPNTEPQSLLAGRCNTLGNLLQKRFSKTGSLQDLDRSIEVLKLAVDCNEQRNKSHDPFRAGSLVNLGCGLAERFRRKGSLEDLENSIRYAEDALKVLPPMSQDRAMVLHQLGISLGARSSLAGKLKNNDIRYCIECHKEAVDITPCDSPDRAIYVYNLALWLHSVDLNGTSDAIGLLEEAILTIPEDGAQWAMFSRLLAYLLGLRWRCSEKKIQSDLDLAIAHAIAALHHENCPPLVSIQAGRVAFDIFMWVRNWEDAYNVARDALDLLSKLTLRSLSPMDKQYMFTEEQDITSFGSDATASAIWAGRDPIDALDCLETGRGVFAASVEELRADVSDLKTKCPSLQKQLSDVRDVLCSPDTSPTWRQEANAEFEKLCEEIRSKPGLERFLLPLSRSDVHTAAENGTIVVINPSQYGSNAILIERDQIRTLRLPHLRREDIFRKSTKLGMPSTLEWLWRTTAEPVLNDLGLNQRPPGNDWRRIWWVVAGPLSKFPIHAAGYHEEPLGDTVLDRVISSYSPSVKAIIQGRKVPVSLSMPSSGDQALLVAMTTTPGNEALQSAMKETMVVKSLCEAMRLEVLEPDPFTGIILNRLPSCKIFHFAKHGNTNSADPSKSHLLLQDWKTHSLSVEALLELNLRQRPPFLAYLSACGTGQIRDNKFADESIHLVNACQLAGFRHVIGTLWKVYDACCVDVAKTTYNWMADNGITDESVCRGLYQATIELRDHWLKETAGAANRGRGDARERNARLHRDVTIVEEESLFWAPYVHFGV